MKGEVIQMTYYWYKPFTTTWQGQSVEMLCSFPYWNPLIQDCKCIFKLIKVPNNYNSFIAMKRILANCVATGNTITSSQRVTTLLD